VTGALSKDASSADILAASALELACALRGRTLSCERVTQVFLERITERNPSLGALVEVWPERALRRARAFDRSFAAGGLPEGIFAGVPTAIKDTDPSRGAFLRMGSRTFRHVWSPVDGPVAMRVRHGGFNVIGRSATSELALLPVIETDIHPPCRNPWAQGFTAGGSSGGAASAVGGALLPIAHASDAAGSIRIPAALCGLVGLKPSRGLLPNFYFGVDPQELCAVHCVARTVDDSAAFLDAMLGKTYAPASPPGDSHLARVRQEPKRARIRFCTSSPLGAVAPEVVDAVRHSAGLLRSLGHELEEAGPLPAELDEFLPIWQRMAANMPLPPFAAVQATTRWLRQRGKQYSRKQIASVARELCERTQRWFGDVDLWLTPTVGPHPPAIGAHTAGSSDPERVFRSLAPLGAFTAPFNLTGQPALTLPAGAFPSGVRIGVQLVVRLTCDDQVLGIGRQLQIARHAGDLPRR
jgi:amidase